MTPLSESSFSYHFYALTFLGSWLIKTRDPVKLYLYVGYKFSVTAVEMYGLYGLILDFFTVFGDMKKMTWNLCVTTLLVGLIIKAQILAYRNETVGDLRMMLHRDAESRHEAEDVAIHKLALKEMKAIRVVFYGTAIIFMPTWFISRYSGFYYGIRELPIPFKLPGWADLEDDVMFHVAYVLLGVSAVFGMLVAMETELAMYGLLVQISREYKILLKDIPKINGMYDEENVGLQDKEVNPCLKKLKTKTMVKSFSARQKALIEYTEAFESCFNIPLLQQFFGMSILIVILALQCLWESVDFSANLLYQMGYLYINIMDMFLLCLFSTRLHSQCLEVGEKVYSTLWYRMAAEVQKDMAMIILRSQRPPKITIGKFMELNLNAFMNTMSNLYSWLALFRQLE